MTESKTFNRAATVILTALVILTMLPIILLMIASVTKEQSLLRDGYSFFPKELSLDAYYYMVKQGAMIGHAYGVSLLVTVAGTVLSLLLTTMLAYPMSRRSFKYQRILSFFVFFTMLFNGGIVPSYILWSRYLHIKNTIWALILPNYLVTAFNVILVKNFYQNNVPDALVEAAQIDGASEMGIFYKIMFPLARPVVATVSLFTGLCYWNDWTNGLYYVRDTQMYGIQNLLNKMISDLTALTQNASGASTVAIAEIPSASVRMAIAFVAMLPILCMYPFLQKYFTKGIALGAVKG